jgi:hypothetical protein
MEGKNRDTFLKQLRNMKSGRENERDRLVKLGQSQASIRRDLTELIDERVTEKLQQFRQPSGQSSYSYSELYSALKSDVLPFPGDHLQEKEKRMKQWRDMVKGVKDAEEEHVIQEAFMAMIHGMEFCNITFYDTHKLNTIAHPQKPDVTGVITGLALHPHSVAVLFELRAFHRSIDGKMKGQLVSAINRVWDKTHQEMFGFAMNGHDDSTFVYHKCAEGTCETAMNVPITQVLLLLQKWDRQIADTQSQLPSTPGYEIRYRLGSGKTSDVFCVSPNSESEKFLVFKSSKPNYQEVVEREALLMGEMLENDELSECPHLAKYETTVEDSSGHTIGFVSYPCGIDKTDGKLSLNVEDVKDLVTTLRLLHKAKFYHRDVTPNNIGHYMNVASRLVFLRDFGFAISHGDANQPYEGAMITASKSILESFQSSGVSFTCRDDFESLVKTFIIALTNCSPLIPLNAVTPGEKASALLDFWQSYDGHISCVVDSLMQEGNDYMSWFVMVLPLRASPMGQSEQKKVPSPTRRPKQGKKPSKRPRKGDQRCGSMGDLSASPLPEPNVKLMSRYHFRPRDKT